MIRRLALADAHALQTLRLLALKHDPLSYVSTLKLEASLPLSYHETKISHNTHEPVFGIYGLFAKDELIGTLFLSYEWLPKLAHTGSLYELFVHPNHRRQGHGHALLSHVIDQAKSFKALEQITLNVNSGNTASINLYKKHGFIQYGTRPQGVKEAGGYQDELLFYLPLLSKD